MKLLLGCLFVLFFTGVYAQLGKLPLKGKNPSNEELRQLVNKIREPRKIILPFGTLRNPAALSAFIKKESGPQLPVAKRSNNLSSRILSEPACIDSSFVKLGGIIDNALYVTSITHTKDDGVLIVGTAFDVTVAHSSWQTYGLLIKTDNMGNILWKKLYNDEQNHEKYDIQTMFVAELQNGDIFTVSSLDTAQGTTSADFTHHQSLFTRLTSTGNLVWYKTYTSLYVLDAQYMPIDIEAIAEAGNGDLVICGNTLFGGGIGVAETVIRLDKAGNKIWDVNFGNNGDYNSGSEALNVFLENGNITVAGIAHGVSAEFILAGSLHFLTLDYATGALLNKRTFSPGYNDLVAQYKNLGYYQNHCVKLNNGHYLLWGLTYSDFSQVADTIDYFAVFEFDATHSLVDAYTISGTVRSTYDGDYLYFDSNGKGLFNLFNNVSPNAYIFEGTIHNKQLLKERVKVYSDAFVGNSSSFGPNQLYCILNDGSYLHCTSYFENYLLANSYFQFKKMHDSDTSSICMGRDSITVKTVPYLISEDPPAVLNPPLFDQVRLTDIRVTYTDEYVYRYKDPCNQKSNCDTLKIHGDSVYCNTLGPKIFSVYKNPLCGSFPEWNIDTAVVSAISMINDTTVSITFKNITWSGKIYASLSTGKCTVALYDSLPIHIVRSQQTLSFGPDALVCPGNSITLHAGPGFASYKWQDGSADSVFSVINPGKYYCEVLDYCGNIYSDTILVNAANYNFTVGPDRSKCNNELITLTATPGFINYQWSPSYNISSAVAESATIFPALDTTYIVTAEKWAGCQVKDTIHITVLHSPVINLGADTSFCQGQLIILNPGTGFNSYKWNTGSSSSTLTTGVAGEYSIAASYSNGCISYDTFKVLKVIPLPVFSLGYNRDTSLCSGQQLSYNFNLNGATYLWNDGSISNSKTIITPGLTWLKVSQQGCSNTDTITAIFKPAPLVNLGSDTMLCEGTTKILNAGSINASYLWQDGSKSPNFTVTKSGLYSVTVTENGCKATDAINITYNLKPLFSLGDDKFVCDGEQLTLQPDNGSAINYRWQDGSNQPVFIVKNPGLYFLSETNSCGSFTDSIRIEMGPCKLQMPSAFTPDKDGKNDLFHIKYPFPVKQFTFLIFNRWGQKIFETADMGKGWDGSYSGIDQPADVYVWIISIINTDGRKESIKGTVALIR